MDFPFVTFSESEEDFQQMSECQKSLLKMFMHTADEHLSFKRSLCSNIYYIIFSAL